MPNPQPNPDCKPCGGTGFIQRKDPLSGYEWAEVCGCVR